MLKRFIDIFKDTYMTLLPAERRKVSILQAGTILSAILQPIAAVGIMPLMMVVTDISKAKENSVIQWLLQKNPMSDKELILVVAIAFFVLIVIASSTSLLVEYKASILSRNIKTNLQKRIFSHQLQQPYEKLTTLDSSSLSSQVGYECDIFREIINSCLKIISNLFVLVCYTFFFMYINFIFFISVSLMVVGVYGIMIYYSNKKIRKYSQQATLFNTLAEKVKRQSYDGIREIKLRGLEKTAIEEFIKWISKFNTSTTILNVLQIFPKNLIMLLLYAGIVISVLFYTFFVTDSADQKITSLVFFAVSIIRVIPTTLEIYNSSISLLSHRYVLPHIKATVSVINDTEMPSFHQTVAAKRTISFTDSLRFEAVTYSYPTASKPALNNLSFQIPFGKTIAFVGKSGSGKTTTADMLLGLLKPNSGNIYIDNKLLDNSTLPSWQKLLAYVPQNIFLMDESLADNISFMETSKNNLQVEKLQQIIFMTSLDDFIKELPHGLQTHVGERGIRLSGGQKQRIGIARALYTEAPVLVFDEATSALDMVTEKSIMDTIFSIRKDKTIIIIAHRLSTVKKADIIYFFENGSVVASGSFSELYETFENFRTMVDAGDENKNENV